MYIYVCTGHLVKVHFSLKCKTGVGADYTCITILTWKHILSSSWNSSPYCSELNREFRYKRFMEFIFGLCLDDLVFHFTIEYCYNRNDQLPNIAHLQKTKKQKPNKKKTQTIYCLLHFTGRNRIILKKIPYRGTKLF